MAPHSHKGQILAELLWSLLFFAAFTSLMIELTGQTDHFNEQHRWRGKGEQRWNH